MFFLSQPYVNVDIRNARTHVKNGKTLYTDYEIKVQVSIVTIDNMKHESDMIYMHFCYDLYVFSETFAHRCSVEKMFLETSQHSQEDTCARVSFLIKILQAWDLELY